MNDSRCDICNQEATYSIRKEYNDGRVIEFRCCLRCVKFVHEIECIYNRKPWWKPFTKRRSFTINDNIKRISTELTGMGRVLGMGFEREG